jgi:hypothetical protein
VSEAPVRKNRSSGKIASVRRRSLARVKNMTRAIGILLFAVLAVALLVSAAVAQQADTGSGGGRKRQKKTDAPAATTPKADEKAYSAALKSLPNKPYDPWSGAR